MYLFLSGGQMEKKYSFIRLYSLLVCLLAIGVTSCAQSSDIQKVPIIYCGEYNVSFGLLIDTPMKCLHPFDGKKYEKIKKYLVQNTGLNEDQFYSPSMVSMDDLRLVHTDEYLNSLYSSSTISHIIDLESLLSVVPNSFLQKKIIEPMKYGTGGTILGADLALKDGWAINLSGGYHHAKNNSGEGGCVFADIPLAIYKLWEKHPQMKVMIIDLDAHQGNGIESILKNDPRVYIFDMYNKNIEHAEKEAAQYINYEIALDGGTLSSEVFGYEMPFWLVEYCKGRCINDAHYLSALKKSLPKAFTDFQKKCGGKKPDLIIYNAGTDIFEQDAWGCMQVSEKGIIERDEFVWSFALQRNVPILMTLAGGYVPESGHIIGRSIENIMHIIDGEK